MIYRGDGHIRFPQRVENSKLPIDRMGGLEQFARGLPAQHVDSGVGVDPEGGIRLSAREFTGLQWPLETRDSGFQVLRQYGLIQHFY